MDQNEYKQAQIFGPVVLEIVLAIFIVQDIFFPLKHVASMKSIILSVL